MENSRQLSYHKVSTLEKEGITSIKGGEGKKDRPNRFKPLRSLSLLGISNKSLSTCSNSVDSDVTYRANLINKSAALPRDRWISYGEGWFQTTSSSSSCFKRCGLHTVLESPSAQVCIFIYEPRSVEAFHACTGDQPEYDLSFQAKMVQSSSGKTKSTPCSGSFFCIIAFKHALDFVSIGFSASTQR